MGPPRGPWASGVGIDASGGKGHLRRPCPPENPYESNVCLSRFPMPVSICQPLASSIGAFPIQPSARFSQPGKDLRGNPGVHGLPSGQTLADLGGGELREGRVEG